MLIASGPDADTVRIRHAPSQSVCVPAGLRSGADNGTVPGGGELSRRGGLGSIKAMAAPPDAVAVTPQRVRSTGGTPGKLGDAKRGGHGET